MLAVVSQLFVVHNGDGVNKSEDLFPFQLKQACQTKKNDGQVSSLTNSEFEWVRTISRLCVIEQKKMHTALLLQLCIA